MMKREVPFLQEHGVHKKGSPLRKQEPPNMNSLVLPEFRDGRKRRMRASIGFLRIRHPQRLFDDHPLHRMPSDKASFRAMLI